MQESRYGGRIPEKNGAEGKENTLLQWVTEGKFDQIFDPYKGTTPEERKEAKLPPIKLEDFRVLEAFDMDSGKGMSGGPVY